MPTVETGSHVNSLPGRTYRSEPRSGPVNRDLDYLVDALGAQSHHDLRSPELHHSESNMVSPDDGRMDVDDDSIQDSVGMSVEESFPGIIMSRCPCASSEVGNYLEHHLEIKGGKRTARDPESSEEGGVKIPNAANAVHLLPGNLWDYVQVLHWISPLPRQLSATTHTEAISRPPSRTTPSHMVVCTTQVASARSEATDRPV